MDGARLEEFLQSWRCLGLDATDNVARLTGWLEEYPDRDAALQELEKEYTRLFITAYPRVIAPPYSSVYLDKECLVWGRSTAEVAKLYEAAGLSMNQDFHDIPDHIAAELEFASYLVAEQQKAREDSSVSTAELASIEKKFLESHLFRWAPVFLSRVIEQSRATFYREIAVLAREFVERDAARD